MKKFLKKISLVIQAVLLLHTSLFASPADSVTQQTLENGFTIFILEDPSSPIIRIEYTVKAGFSSQTQNTTGFYKLYSRIFEKSLPQLVFEDASCYSDSSRYILQSTPSQTKKIFTLLAQTAFSPMFTDELIKSELTKLKNETMAEKSSMGTLINSAIDSKVFSDAPWKHDSGVYAPLFNKTTLEQARTILTLISERWYTPQNSALFISGNVNSKEIINLAQQTFGTYYSSYKIPNEQKKEEKNKQKKFVIHDKEISSEMSQIVMQFNNISNMENADLVAAIINNNKSFFKYNLIAQNELNIPGEEYIDVNAAHKKGCSRIIIQAIMQPPEDKTIKINSLEQVQTFTAKAKQGIRQITKGEFEEFKKQLIFDMNFYNTNSAVFMDKLSSYWAIDKYSDLIISTEQAQIENVESVTVQNFLTRITKIQNADFDSIINSIFSENPYIFIIINSNDFIKNKDKYLNAGYEEINLSNASWYTQPIFDDEKKEQPEEDERKSYEQIQIENDFYELNKSQIEQKKLKNGIPLTTKYNPNTSQISLLISIRGGLMNSADNNGFEEAMISIFVTNMQKELFLSSQNGDIKGIPSIFYNIDLCNSTICLECEKEDFEVCAKAISNAIIFSEIIPSAADKAVSNKQHTKRLENGSANYQIYCEMIKQIYPKTDLTKIYDSTTDILTKTTYQNLLEAYPKLLDSSRYSLILTGNFDENAETILNKTISLLGNQKGEVHYSTFKTKMPSNKSVSTKIIHTFLTDIPKEKAGPMPAVLIPTTEFLDPVLYAFEAPEIDSKNFYYYEAMLYYLEYQLNKQISENTKLNSTKALAKRSNSIINCAAITFQNVNHTKEIDSIYTLLIKNLKADLKSNKANEILQKIKDIWLTSQLSKASTNTGTAYLIQEGTELFPFEQKPLFYLEEYNVIQNAKTQDFIDILKYFPEQPNLKIYSTEGKK